MSSSDPTISTETQAPQHSFAPNRGNESRVLPAGIRALQAPLETRALWALHIGLSNARNSLEHATSPIEAERLKAIKSAEEAVYWLQNIPSELAGYPDGAGNLEHHVDMAEATLNLPPVHSRWLQDANEARIAPAGLLPPDASPGRLLTQEEVDVLVANAAGGRPLLPPQGDVILAAGS